MKRKNDGTLLSVFKIEKKTENKADDGKKIEPAGPYDGLEDLIIPEWRNPLAVEFKKDYWKGISRKLNEDIINSKVIYPKKDNIFRALNVCPPNKVKIVIVGQDNYYSGYADGLAFSVPPGVDIPPSLQNIYGELYSDPELKVEEKQDGNLESWANQGVLLLNSTLTVEHGQPNSHEAYGWINFTDKVIEHVVKNCKHVVFMLWGAYAKKKSKLIKGDHLVLQAGHPSPKNPTGFRGCRHFSKANKYLEEHGKTIINF